MPSREQIAGRAGYRVLAFVPCAEEAASVEPEFAMRGMRAQICDDADTGLAIVCSDPPDLIVIHERFGPRGGLHFARSLRTDSAFAHLPILFVLPSEKRLEVLSESDFFFDDYIEEDAAPEEFLARSALCIQRAQRHMDANPLTGLPGNTSIIRELDRRLAAGEEFAAVYADLDHFKAFNDRYGFTRGDEALKLTARLMVNSVAQVSPRDSYPGHIGGDDFLFIAPIEKVEEACKRFIAYFDSLVATLYDDTERALGCIRSVNRRGEAETFPIMAISLAVVLCTGKRFSHTGEISAVAAELKKVAKRDPKSNYIIDRRGEPA